MWKKISEKCCHDLLRQVNWISNGNARPGLSIGTVADEADLSCAGEAPGCLHLSSIGSLRHQVVGLLLVCLVPVPVVSVPPYVLYMLKEVFGPDSITAR